MKNYEEPKMQVITFGDSDVFTWLDIDPSADDDGGGSSQHSVNPGFSDY